MTNRFIPDTEYPDIDLPNVEDARAEDGWKGQSTKKSYEQLRAEIAAEIGRLGGTMSRFTRGEYTIDDRQRPGVQIEYNIVSPTGQIFTGRIDVAALPFKEPKQAGRYEEVARNRKEHTMRMALYNIREALQSARIMQSLSPGYVALIPWLILQDGRTMTEIWSMGVKALPVPSDDDNGDTVDAPFREIED